MPGKALFFIPTAKTPIPAVWDWIDRTDYVDKLIIRNMQKDTADEIAMQFFFLQDEYDYFIITTDDVMGHPAQVQALLDAEEDNGFPILSGWCNHLDNWASLSLDPINPLILGKAFNEPFPGLSLEDYNFALRSDIAEGAFGFPFFNAWFTGIPLTLIQKKTLKMVPFREWRREKDRFCITEQAKAEGRGVMQDVQWAIDCAEKGISITTDVRLFLLHLFDTSRSTLRVGRFTPQISFIPSKDMERYPQELGEIETVLKELSDSAWTERKLTRKTYI